ncbi:MAG: O-antigen ligase family protein [Pseudomonadaceae bacterium]|nr:O-antigen ligase family protein [Pseudomonadaceae bacterium]
MNGLLSKREDSLVWIFSAFIFLFVLVQVHVVFFNFAVNVNLADFFVMLVMSTLAIEFIYTKKPVFWKVKHFNIYAFLTLAAMICGWLVAFLSDYSITWAGTKLTGWLIILGYLYASAMLVNRLGFFTFLRFFNLLLVFFVLVLLLSDIVMFIEILRGLDGSAVYVSYLTALSGNRNALAFQILAVLSLALAFQPLYKKKTKINQFFLLCCVIVLVASMFFTASRSGIAVMLILYSFALILKMADWRFLFLSMTFGLVLSGLVLYTPEIFYFLSNMFSQDVQGEQSARVVMRVSSTESDMLRIQLIKDAFSIWLEHPFFGAGLGAFYTGSAAVYGTAIVQHNSVMWVLSEMGVFGLLVFAALFLSLIKFAFFSSRRRGIRQNAVILLLLALGAMAMFHEMLYQRIFWLFLGAVIAVGFSDRKSATVLSDEATA